MSRSRHWLLVAGVLALGMTLRCLYLAELAGDPAFEFPGVDAGYHDAWARMIYTQVVPGPGYHDVSSVQATPYFRPPGYSYFLAAIYALTNGSFLAPRVVQMVLGVLGIGLTYWLARLASGQRAGLIAALLTAIAWPLIYFEGELLEPVLLVVLELAILIALSLMTRRATIWRAFIAGALCGLFALTRPNILLIIPLFGLWTALVVRQQRTSSPDTASSHPHHCRTGLSAAGALFLGALFVITPCTIRNYRVSGEFVLISSNGGINLYIGNNPKADGLFMREIETFGNLATSDSYDRIKRQLEHETGRPLTYAETSRYFSGKAFAFIREQPGSFLRLIWRKALLFWGPVEAGHNRSIQDDRFFSPWLHRFPVGFPLAASTALAAGLLLLYQRRRSAQRPATTAVYSPLLLVVVYILAYFGTFLPFFVTGQYRAPLIPLLLVVGSHGIDHLLTAVQRRQLGKSLIGLTLQAACLGLCLVNWPGYVPNRAKWHADHATALRSVHDRPGAIEHYTEAIRLSPGFADPYVSLSELLDEMGRGDEALALARQAVLIDSASLRSQNQLASILYRKGDMNGAIAALKRASELAPTEPIVRQNLAAACTQYAAALGEAGRIPEAISLLRLATNAAPDMAQAYHNLGCALVLQGDRAEARKVLQRALTLEPGRDLTRQVLRQLDESGVKLGPRVDL